MGTKRTLLVAVGWAFLIVGTLLSLPWVAPGLAHWGATAGPTSDEWIELHNVSYYPVNLEGWTLSDGRELYITLTGSIPPGGYFLLERGDDKTVREVPADRIYEGNLDDAGEVLTLRDASGAVVDTANADGGPWPAGTGSPDFRSMERVSPFLPDSDDNWTSNDTVYRRGHGATGALINGTPRGANSTSLPTADLAVSKMGPPTATLGAAITYSLVVSNVGELIAPNVRITDTLPTGVHFVSQESPYAFVLVDSHTLVWEAGEIGPEGQGRITVTGRVSPKASGTLVNQVLAASAIAEVTATNNLAVAGTIVARRADLSEEMPHPFDLAGGKVGPAAIRAGDPISYTLVVSNIGELEATDVRVTDTLPAGVIFISQTSPYTFTRPALDILLWEIDTLSGSTSARITLYGRVGATATGALTNVLSVTRMATDTETANNTAMWVTTVLLPAEEKVVINEVAWAMRETLPLLVLVLIGLGFPLILGLPLLGRARNWLSGQAPRLAALYFALGILWAVAGPLSVLNFRYGRILLAVGAQHPLGLVLAGVVPPLVGLVYLAQAGTTWLPGRARVRRLGGWVYLAIALLQAILGLVTWSQGETLFLVAWLTQASLMVVMAASLFEQRVQVMGAFFVSLALAIGLLFIPGVEAGQISTFVLDPVGRMETWSVRPVVLPAGATIVILVSIAACLGLWQAVRETRLARAVVGGLLGTGVVLTLVLLAIHYSLSTSFFLLVILALTLGMATWQILRTRETNGILGAILFLFILAFLIWASEGRDFNFTGMLISMLGAATPIALGALSGVWCERSAVINIAIEGMMLSAAFTAVVVSSATDSLVLGLLVGMLTGGALAALLAVLAIRFKVDQIIAGTAINIFAVGATSFLAARLLVEREDLNTSSSFPPVGLPVLSRVPVIGPVLFQNNLLVYMMLLSVVITHIVLFRTRWGLRSRSVGEHPMAADTLGVNVFVTRYINVIIGGLIAGLGGSYLTLGSVGRFDEVMTAGKGFIGLAAMIFGRWNPFGAFGASLIFGFADSTAAKLGILEVPISSHFLLMAPYLATIVVLAGVVGRAIPPAADGEPYEKH